ncbi:MAG: AAA family ATPase [bacterium]|nr:AAA family ATPase [bacterium]
MPKNANKIAAKSAANTALEKRSGYVETVFFTGAAFTTGRFCDSDGKCFNFAGAVKIAENEPVVLYGKLTIHPKYGRQFTVERFEYDFQPSVEGLTNYLANHPDIKGIGPVKASSIARRFNGSFEATLRDHPEVIAQFAQVPLSAIEQLKSIWNRNRTENAAATYLSQFGLTHYQVKTLLDEFGNDVVALFRQNPYQIIGVLHGFGFKKIDTIARKMGILKASPERLRAGLLHAVNEQIDHGHCWVSFDDLVEHANELLILDTLDSTDQIKHELAYLIEMKQLVSVSISNQTIIARPDLYAKEKDIRAWITVNQRLNPDFADLAGLEGLLDQNSSTLNEGQRAAVLSALQHQISVIAGGAGSGKTFTVGTITRICEVHGLSVTLAAPTGKAAKRLEQLIGHEAVTLHRLLGYNGRVYLAGPEVPIEAEVLIIDEFSMVDVPLAWQLFRAIDWEHTAVVMVGDPNQLPPVGPGNILRDLLSTKIVPITVLDRIVRQAGLLKENCTAILSGEVHKTAPEIPGQTRRPWYLVDQFSDVEDVRRFILDMFSNLLSNRLGYDLIRDVQLISPTKKGPLGTIELNIALQQLLQKKLYNVDTVLPRAGQQQRKFYRHDKVIQTRNNYDINVMNGSLGWVLENDPKAGITVEFENGTITTIEPGAPELQELSLAYALTVHKVQGSEFPCVVAVMHKAHTYMHHRNLFYTAVTRARETSIIIGDRWGLTNCARVVQTERRRTFLSLSGSV